MKKLISILLVATLMVSLTGCGLILGKDIELEEGQMHVIFSEEGEMTMVVYAEDKELEADMDIDFDDDEEDIQDDIQDYFEDEFEDVKDMMDLDIDIEVTEVAKKDDYAIVTLVFSDFELMFMEWFESVEDMADNYDEMEDLADEMEFVEFKNDEEIDEDDLEDYEDNFIMILDGGEEGTYYEFPSEILLVQGDMKYERINDNIIFVDDDESGAVVVTDAIEGEPFDLYTMLDDYNFDDMDLDDIDLDDMEFDFDGLDPDDIDLDDFDIDMDDLDYDWSGGEAEAGNPNDLQAGQLHIIINGDGTYHQKSYIENENLEWELDADYTLSEAEITQQIKDHFLNWYGDEIEVLTVEKHNDGVYYEMYVAQGEYMIYDYHYTLEDQAEYYEGGIPGLLNTYTFMDGNRNELSLEDMNALADNHAMWLNDSYEGAYYTFPSSIKAIDSYMTWDLVDDKTIFIDDWSYGLVVY